MTVSGIAAKGLSPDFIIRRKAAKCACPQLAAVLGTDTELRFAVIPVILFLLLYRVSGYKGIKFPSSGNEIFHVFFCKELLSEATLFQYLPIPQTLTSKTFKLITDFLCHSVQCNTLLTADFPFLGTVWPRA